MADSIHDQWPTATDEWPRVAAQFLAAWISIVADYDLNDVDAAMAAGIGYVALMLQDSTVMAGDMITHIAQTGSNATAGLVNNIQALQTTVLPQWGYLAAQYANTAVFNGVAQEQSARQAADAVEAQLRALGDDQTRQLDTAAINQEALQRGLGDTNVMQQMTALINAETAARKAGDIAVLQQANAAIAQLGAQLAAQIANVLAYAQTLPGLIDQRAAAGYDPTLRDQGSLVQKILDTVVAHDPTVAQLVSQLAGFIVDLAGVEDPVLRIAAQLVLKQVIDRLGVDTALHAMLNDLIGGILGGGQPNTLTAIMGDIGNRLDALEETTAALAPLAPEADQLSELGTLVFDASLLAYFTAAVVDPVATANDTVDVLAPVTGPLLAPIRLMLGMG